MRNGLSDEKGNEILSEIGKLTNGILDAQTEEDAFILLGRGIDKGPFNVPTPEVAENLFWVIYNTSSWPSVRKLAIKQLKSLNFSEEQHLKNEGMLTQLFLREKINLMIGVKAIDIPEGEALLWFKKGVELGFFENTSDTVIRGLEAIINETPHASLKIEVIKVLEALNLSDADKARCLEKVQNGLRVQNEICALANLILESEDEVEAIEKLIQLYTKFSGAEPDKLQKVLWAIFHRSNRVAVQNIAQKLLGRISIEVEFDVASRDKRQGGSEDSASPPIVWLPIKSSNPLD